MGKKSIFPANIITGLGIIQGWKSIGRYLGRSGRTARRWYDAGHLPIHYNFTGRPFAFVFELDTFMVAVSDVLKKPAANDREEREKKGRHAAMMRSRKRARRGENIEFVKVP